MVAKSILPDEETKTIMQRIEQARRDRSYFAARYNEFLDLTKPYRRRVNDGANSSPRPASEQDDLFDTTLQEAADDFASDANDEFTPSYKPWTKHVPTAEFSGEAAKAKVQKYVDARMEQLYDRIRESNFDEAAQEMWFDVGMMPSGLLIRYTRPGQPISVVPVPIDQLLILPGPFGGVDDRWREVPVMVRDLDTLWPQLDWSDHGATKEDRRKSMKTVVVTDGGFRDWDATEEVWHWHVICQKKVLRRRTYRGRGSCPMVVARTHVTAPTAYGVGIANKAIPPARTLGELNYMALDDVGRRLNPPTIFYDDGILNPEAGIEQGDWLPASNEFKVQELRPEGNVREAWFKEEELRMSIKRAFFQDGPVQRGDTPPTLGQWMSEESRVARRKSFPRTRLHSELTLPVLRRFEWIMERRGEIEELKVEGNLVNVQPVSPLSKSADIEEAQLAMQYLQGVGTTLPNEMGRINGSKTMTAIRDKMGAKLVTILDDDEYEEKLSQQLGTAGESKANLNI